MLKRQLSRDQPEEVVEDSEPEREEARKRRKEERRKRRDQRNADNKIIELTDSDSHGPTSRYDFGQVNPTEGPRRSEVPANASALSSPTFSRNNRSSSDIFDIAFVRVFADTSRVDSIKADAITGIAAHTVVPGSQSLQSIILTDTEGDASGSEVEERTDKMRTKLGRYSFSTTSQTSSRAGRSFRALSTVADAIDVAEAPKGVPMHVKRSTGPVAFYLDFSEGQLQSISKCVSCDLKWTTRKTVGHKVAHMRACAKKTRLTEETIKVLISREVKMGSQQAAKVKAIREQVEKLPPKTFLEHMVNDGDVQRAAKRQKKVSSSVRGIVETRNDILDRAKLLLNQPPSSQLTLDDRITMQPPMSTQAFGPSGLGTRTTLLPSCSDRDAEFPCTQALPESGHAAALADPRSGSQALELISDPPSVDASSSTQVFGTSRLSLITHTGPSLLGADTTLDTHLY